MKQAIDILLRTKQLRFLFCFGGGVLLALILSIFTHYRYWYVTIKSVQETKLHIISETVPTQLSLLIVNKQENKIQKLLNSTEGSVGLVVTNCQKKIDICSDEKILYQTSVDGGWQRDFQANNLNLYPFDPLTNPPLNVDRTLVNKNEIIGRVYYVRLSPQTFLQELREWIINILSLKTHSIFHPYTAFLASTLLSSFVAWKFIEKEIEKSESLAKLRQKQLELDFKELKNRNSKLILDKQDFNQEVDSLNEQITQLKDKTSNFKQEIKKKEEKLSNQEQNILKSQNILKYYEQELTRIKKIKIINEEEKQDLELKIKLQQTNLQEQESDLKNYIEDLKIANQELVLNQYKEETMMRLLKQREQEKQEKLRLQQLSSE